MLALLKLLFAVLLLLNVAVFVLFIFWPADRVKQIQETLAHVNITEKYFAGRDSKEVGSLKSKNEIKENKNWKERSPDELKVYLSKRGVDLTEIDSEEYLGEMLGIKPIKTSTEINLIKPNGRDLSTGKLLIATGSESNILTSELKSSQKLSILSEGNLSITSTVTTSDSEITTVAKRAIDVSREAQKAMKSVTLVVESTSSGSFINQTTLHQPIAVFSSTKTDMSSDTNLVEKDLNSANPVSVPSLGKVTTRVETDDSLEVSEEVHTTEVIKTPKRKTNETISVSGSNKIYELNALIYNPLELPQPDAIFVECCDNNSIKVYLPSNVIENTSGTYLSQDHLELWLDRTSVKPRNGYGEISHQFGVGLSNEPWVIDFLQSDSNWKLIVATEVKGEILVVTIQNLPPDLRAWNIVFSKSVKEGKNWVQGQLLSAVEQFSWGNPDHLIPFKVGSEKNETQ